MTQKVTAVDKRTGAQRRRAAAQDSARKMLNACSYIRGIVAVIDKAGKASPEKIPGLRLQFDGFRTLLAKVLPDLKAVEVTGDGSIQTVVFVPVTAASAEEWAAQVRVEQERRVLPGVLIEQQPTDEG